MYCYIDEEDYPVKYNDEVLAHEKAILAIVSSATGERIEMFEKTFSILFGQRIRIEYDWVGHRNKLFLATRDDAFAQNVWNEDMYYDAYDEPDYDYDRY